MARDSTWTNSDGLVVGFGTHTVDNNVPGVYKGANGVTTMIAEYDLADLPDTFAATNVPPQAARIPRGSIIRNVLVQAIVGATSGGSATLDVGLWGVGLATEVVDDADGLCVDIPVAAIANIGDVAVGYGALVAFDGTGTEDDKGLAVAGATSNSDCVLAPSYETAVFTAGRVRIIVSYVEPSGSSGDSLAV